MTDYNQNFERELDWGDELTQDAKDFVLLPQGDYKFTVTGFERKRHTPNLQNPGKLPACPKAEITVLVETEEGDAVMTHNLFLHTSTEGMLSAFFGAIGQKKHGEPLKMNWNAVMGATGVCRVNHREYNGEKYNNIKSMIYADKVDWSKVLNANASSQQNAYNQQSQPAYTQQSTYQQPQQGYQQPAPNAYSQQQPAGGYQAGQF